MAKERHDLEFGLNMPLNRVKIRKYKKEIRRQFNSGELRASMFKRQHAEI